MIVRSKAPVRVSFAGGGTDVSPYCEEHGGCVVSASINTYAWCTLELRRDKKIFMQDTYSELMKFKSFRFLKYGTELDLLIAVVKNMWTPEKGINLFLRNDVLPRSGLGSSATAFVSLIGLFNHLKREHKMTDYEVAELAYRLEREELKNKGGRQDQYAAVFGGVNYIEFKGDDFVRVNPLRIKKDYILELEKNLLLVYAMDRSVSGDIITDQTKSYMEHKKTVVEALNRSKELAVEVNYALRKGDFEYFGKLLHEGWEAKKKFSPLMTNKYLDSIYQLARKKGALGGKITGAGGGGHMFFYCESNKEQVVARRLEEAGARVVPFTFDLEGLQTWEVV
jgi:D-glycero-alpha-D-manno-heptose-7-phosphate kinase